MWVLAMGRIRIRVEARGWKGRAMVIRRAFWVCKMLIQTVGMVVAMGGLILQYIHRGQAISRRSKRKLTELFYDYVGGYEIYT